MPVPTRTAFKLGFNPCISHTTVLVCLSSLVTVTLACTIERHHALFTGGKCMHREIRLFAHSHTAKQNMNPKPLGLDPSCPPASSGHCEGSSNQHLHYGKRIKTLQTQSCPCAPSRSHTQQCGLQMLTHTHTVLITQNTRGLPFKAAYDTLRVFNTRATCFLPQPAQHLEGLLHQKDV